MTRAFLLARRNESLIYFDGPQGYTKHNLGVKLSPDMTSEPRIEWRWGVLAALAMTCVGLYPQLSFWFSRGSEFHGSYVLTQGDETTYSAYVNALIDGRPRRNDPFSGQDALPDQPAYESLHSIQFIPAYLVALPAKAFGVSGSTAFIWLLIVAAFASTLAIFWLFVVLTGDSKSAAVGALLTLCFGTLVGSDCCWQTNAFTEMFPFLRRYQPAAVFPLFFIFCLFVWRAVTSESSRSRLINALVAGTSLSVLVFSYFYLWTAAMAWLACVVVLWILFRRDQFRQIAITTIVIGAFAVVSIITFLIMFLSRNPITHEGQLLVSTHAPDFSNQPQIVGFIALVVLLHAAWRKVVDIHSPLVIFTMSFALMPLVVFNQQIATGISLQPVHYKVFIANYVALISLLLVFLLLWRARVPQRSIPSLVLILTAAGALCWGLFGVSEAAARREPQAQLRDDMRAVAERLTAMANEDGSAPAALAGHAPFPTVFTYAVDERLEASIAIPSDSPMAILYSLHSHAFIGVSESKERFYRHLYYTGMTPKKVGVAMREREFWVVAPLLGPERVVRGLVPVQKPITLDEIHAERQQYADFYNNFSREQAANPTLNFVVVPNGPDLPNFANLDHWYERDSGQKVGAFTIYRVKLRP